MKIRKLTPKNLKTYIYSDEYAEASVVSISRHRALSHIHNPRVDADDIVMVMAYEEEEMVGYLGVLADWVYLNGSRQKGGWLSCMWVDPRMRGKGIAKQLLKTVLDAWDQRILVTEFTPAAKGLYDRSEAFIDLAQPVGIRAYLRSNLHYLLPHKEPRITAATGFLKGVDALPNAFNDIRLKLTNTQPAIQWEYIDAIDEELDAFIRARQEGQLFRRTAEDINWIIRYPWVLTGPFPDGISQRYHFSATDTRFHWLAMRLYNTQKKLIGCIILAVRGNNLKVPYCYVQEMYIPEVAKLIYHHMVRLKLNMVTLFHPDLVTYMRHSRTPFVGIRPIQRHYIISKVFGWDAESAVPPVIQDGDADCAFT